ncbi:calpain-13 [Elgaria multicarinata webbii]|uniref:calpain-13 n=1 Tax=Elgaria multicarinata webbii TaxID=159646 RepID=UPI002FCCF9E8
MEEKLKSLLVQERDKNPVMDMDNLGGAGSLASPLKFKNQDFARLRDHCLNRRLLFEDDTFPAHSSSIGSHLLPEVQLHQIEWLRPTELLSNPHLIVDGMSRFDIVQGQVGDCWVLAALGSLTLQKRFLGNVVPKDQGFEQNYAGIFHFRFWYFGHWVDVVIDDRLPFLNGRYLSVHPHRKNEFWPPLLEKAYAKLRGSYQKLHWGFISEALVDFTGGVEVSFNLKSPSSFLHEIVKNAANSGCLMGCTTPEAESRDNIELKNGIVLGHAYTVVSATEVPYMDGKEHLIRIWNPWGHGEWKGAWSDSSGEWDRVPKQYKKTLYENKDNGEFWMSCKDFQENFTTLCVCNNVPTFLNFGEQSNWSMDMHVIHHNGAFSRNPQYSIQVLEPEMKNYNVVVSVAQKPMNNTRPIGFLIDKVGPQGRNRYYKMALVQMRDITNYFHLLPGTYVIAPTASQEGQDFEFLLRIFLKNPKNLREPNTELIRAEGTTGKDGASAVPKSLLKRNQDNSYENIFLRYAKQGSYLDASQLQRILNEVVLEDLMASLGSGDGFSFDSCRSLLALMDIDANGLLTLQNFEKLWKDIKKYKDIFRSEDENDHGFLNVSNLGKAIQNTGVSISDKLLQMMATRYGDTSMRINFPDFVCCMVRLETMEKVFRNLSADGRKICFTEDENGVATGAANQSSAGAIREGGRRRQSLRHRGHEKDDVRKGGALVVGVARPLVLSRRDSSAQHLLRFGTGLSKAQVSEKSFYGN